MVMDMIRKCKICEKVFETKSSTRIYCYECSGNSIRSDNETRKHQKTILRRNMKLQAIKMLGGKCSICGYNKCVDALEFHHKNPKEKEFKLGSGNTMSWEEYKNELKKCILVCSNCHKEIHSKIGYMS
jgi:5-methylcytosine-specific restriction endonuclease McrA